MRNRLAIAGGLAVSVAFSLGVTDKSVAAAAKVTCSKKNVGAVNGTKLCALQKRRYVWVAAPATIAPATSTATIPVDSGSATPTENAQGTQRLKGPGGGWSLDVPASWSIDASVPGSVSATDRQTGAELWMGTSSGRGKYEAAIADNPGLMKGQYGVNLFKSEPGTYAGSDIQTLWYSEPGSSKRIVVRLYRRELSVGGFLTAEITVKSDETEAMLLGSLDRMDVRWR